MSFAPSSLHGPSSLSLVDLSSSVDDGMFEKSPVDFSPISPTDPPKFAPTKQIYSLWRESRMCGTFGEPLAPGSQRPFSRANLRIAGNIVRSCATELICLIWGMHPNRTAAMMLLNAVRGLFPAFRGFSQALIINELQSVLSSDHFTIARLARLLAGELSRMALESLLDSLAQHNETIVNNSARFVIEYQQINLRARLDAPALADPDVRDLLQESDLFVGSFAGMGGFGLLSPLECLRGLALVTELFAHLYILLSLTRSLTHVGILFLSLASSLLPFVDIWSWIGFARRESYPLYTPAESRHSEKQLKMRGLVHGETYRSEILVFGLSSWIVDSWASARQAMLGLENDRPLECPDVFSALYSHVNTAEITALLQNLPLFLFFQSSTSSLGSVALYRNSIYSLIFTARNLIHIVRTGFSSIFLMGAFCAAMELQPKLKPSEGLEIPYQSAEKGGVKIQAKSLTYTYPGAKEPALRGVSFDLEAGETLAIVGYNGSGKSTLANILLRLQDFDSGELLINGTSIRSLDPAEYHSHVTTVLQNFVRYEASARDNIGVGCVSDIRSRTAIERAMALGGAEKLVNGLPRGISTQLDSTGAGFGGFPPLPCPMIPGVPHDESHLRHGLSGGEWQRIAISRAFMRAHRPEVDLMLFDEPTSALDAHAQTSVFEVIDRIARPPSGEKKKTVIFITHRLATARRADKILMLDNGNVAEFGSHNELMEKDGPYAALYRASI